MSVIRVLHTNVLKFDEGTSHTNEDNSKRTGTLNKIRNLVSPAVNVIYIRGLHRLDASGHERFSMLQANIHI